MSNYKFEIEVTTENEMNLAELHSTEPLTYTYDLDEFMDMESLREQIIEDFKALELATTDEVPDDIKFDIIIVSVSDDIPDDAVEGNEIISEFWDVLNNEHTEKILDWKREVGITLYNLIRDFENYYICETRQEFEDYVLEIVQDNIPDHLLGYFNLGEYADDCLRNDYTETSSGYFLNY